MLNALRKARAQSTLEYAVLVIIIIGALLAVQTYIKRGVQGRLKSSTDDIGDQFSPNNTNVVETVIRKSNVAQVYGLDAAGLPKQGVSSSTILTPETTNTQRQQQIVNVDSEDWGK